MKSKSGFTLVELVIVCTVIAILASIVTFTYLSSMRSSHDNARVQGVRTLVNYMNAYYQKNADYPITCFPSLGVLDCASIPAGGTDIIPPNTSSDTLKTIFPSFDSTFTDPLGNSSTPINHRLTSTGPIQADSYFLLSTDTITSGTLTLSFAPRSGSAFSCNFTADTSNINGVADPAGNPRSHGLIVGAWSESLGAWMFFTVLPTADQDTLTWNTAKTSLCNASTYTF